MYAVQFESPSVESPEHFETEWVDIHVVPQLVSEQVELMEARQVARLARQYHQNVRIVKSHSTYLEIVR